MPNTALSLKNNFKALATALKAVNAEHVEIEYEGYGDSGDIESVRVYPPTIDLTALPEVTYAVNTWEYVQGKSQLVCKEQKSGFETAARDIAWDAIEQAGHRGFEINEGGGGSLTVFANGHAELEHRDNMEAESEPTTYVADAGSPQRSAIQTLAAALKAAGFEEARIDYSGSGDSGDVFEITLEAPGQDATAMDDPADVAYQILDYQWNAAAGRSVRVPVQRTASFRQALEDVFNELIEEVGLGGWENNEGGSGTATLTAEGVFTIEHSYTQIDTDSSTTTWNDSDNQ